MDLIVESVIVSIGQQSFKIRVTETEGNLFQSCQRVTVEEDECGDENEHDDPGEDDGDGDQFDYSDEDISEFDYNYIHRKTLEQSPFQRVTVEEDVCGDENEHDDPGEDDEDDDQLDKSDEVISNFDSDHIHRETLGQSPILETASIKSRCSNMRMPITSPRLLSPEEYTFVKLLNQPVEYVSPNHGLMQRSPNTSPKLNHINTPNGLMVENFLEKAQPDYIEEVIKTPTKELSADIILERTHFKNKAEESVDNTLKSTKISGKLMKLLSRNLSITEKLEGEDKDKVNYNKDFARMERYDQIQEIKKNKNQHQIEQRITRSQLRFMEENIKRRTRANSRITRSGNSSTSITVTQRLEEVGTTCGMKKGKIGNKKFNNCSRKGALIGNQ
ncbi:hypothetical protein L2E82_22466 [Cichorium intybus]|uniref:Uncharacterized protein n=1 Tax=Cichorium intybus TaxID=13427 RepID=A0ACB9DXV4_CICIN|nr:hypothetical protein L2E82_22466 [Cichorium intybus]